jgi:hypothetical protein
MTVEEIFSQTIEHMLKGFMFHEQMANYYDFLGLEGYSKCHEYHYFKESRAYRELYHYYITTYNKLLPETRFENPNAIPQGWIGYRRQEVDSKTLRAAVKDGLDSWVSWEIETKKLYEKMAKELLAIGAVGAELQFEALICDVEEELATAEKYQLHKNATDYDIVDIIEEQKPLYKRFNK